MPEPTRRRLLAAAGLVPAALLGSAAPQAVKIVGISCSPRRGKTTAAAVQMALEAARGVSPLIETEFVDLGGLKINGDLAAGIPLAPGERDDFPRIEAILRGAGVGGILIGTPVYFSNMSSLCKAFLDRWIAFRKGFALRNKIGGVLAVGSSRNGGQELTLQTIHAAMLGQDMVIVSQGPPAPRLGGALVAANDSISADETGVNSAKGVGRRVAEVALLLRKGETCAAAQR